ncbi:multiubiquitin domain-containing protein [Novipirellula sp.]|uniref:multiubiquitin domain-containing protein n=1 Tax=Novipirellula sp. TaxID=2795430 RepID=UPI003562780F
MSERNRPKRGHRVLVANDQLEFKPYQIDDPVPLGRQILEASGYDSDGDASLALILESGDFEDVRLDEKVDLRKRGAERFIAFKTDRSYRFEVEGDQQHWGMPCISGQVLRQLAKAGEDEVVYLEIRGGQDRLIDPTDLVDLNEPGVERFFKAPKPDPSVKIIVNTREKTVPSKDVTFDQIVQLAYPGNHGENEEFTVTFDGALSCPNDGNLGAGGTIQVKQGTIFHVKRTIRS